MAVTINLRHFAVVREAVGASAESRAYDAPPTAAQVFDELASAHPALSGLRRSILVMINQTYASPDTVLATDTALTYVSATPTLSWPAASSWSRKVTMPKAPVRAASSACAVL